MENVVIIGGGPAGLTAAIYTGRAGLNPLLINGPEPGGRITTTSELENYPGFPEGIGGFEIMQRITEQAEKFAARMVSETVTEVNFKEEPYIIRTGEDNYETGAVIIATGSRARQLGLEREEELTGKGISYCATCDGPLFRDREVAVVGGGNVALEEANFLTGFASRVYLIHRRDKFRGSRILAEKAESNEKIDILWNTEVKGLQGEESLAGLIVENNKTGLRKELTGIGGLFIAVGQKPRTELFTGEINLDRKGYVITDKKQATDKEGIYAAGDCQDPHYQQVVIAAGSGAKAALEVYKYLEGY